MKRFPPLSVVALFPVATASWRRVANLARAPLDCELRGALRDDVPDSSRGAAVGCEPNLAGVVSGRHAQPAVVGLQEAAARLALISVLFVALYLASNQVSHARGGIAGGVFEWERGIPFVPWTVVPYLSIFAFFVLSFVVDRRTRAMQRYCAALVLNLVLALACYALFPLQFTFERPLPQGVFGPFFELLYAVDLPYNRAPSLHISVLVLLWWRLRPGLGRVGRIAVGAWFGLVAVSVLTTYQHHVIDIPAGVAIAWVSLVLARRMPNEPVPAVAAPDQARGPWEVESTRGAQAPSDDGGGRPAGHRVSAAPRSSGHRATARRLAASGR